MDIKKIYEDDLKIAHAIINRDELVTLEFFYKHCYPLFKTFFNNYYTDCTDCKEFIDEIYVLVVTPSKTTGHCQLENYRGESSLITWIKSVCLFYCYNKFETKKKMPEHEPYHNAYDDDNSNDGDRYEAIYGSTIIDSDSLDRDDAIKALRSMPNERYSKLLELRYLKEMSNEEAAKAMGMNMERYYNVHKRAKDQFTRIYRKEDFYD